MTASDHRAGDAKAPATAAAGAPAAAVAGAPAAVPTQLPTVRRHAGDQHWEHVDVLVYKNEGAAPFRAVTRQVLFADAALGCELRYFEVAPNGYTTLERHEHAHAVMIQRGRGRCLVGEAVHAVAPLDLVHVPAHTWHQFRAGPGEPLGFVCMVNAVRDRPQLPGDADLARLRERPEVAAFLSGKETE